MYSRRYLDRLTPDWIVLDVMRATSRKWNWVALMIDVDPDDLKNCICNGPALLYVHPQDYKPGLREAHQAWFRESSRSMFNPARIS